MLQALYNKENGIGKQYKKYENFTFFSVFFL